MIVVTHFLKEFLDIESMDMDEVCSGLDLAGFEVESCKRLSLPRKVVVGRVLEKKKHPSADRLWVCRVDVGSNILQIVCGAGNVREEAFVAVAKEGAILESQGKKIEIKTTKLRDVESQGMICSAAELGLPKIYDGILIMDSSIGELKLGEEVANYPIFNTYLLDLSLTPNRGDCLYLLGVARELRVIFNLALKKPKDYVSTNQIGIGRKMQIAIKNSKIDSSLLYKAVEFHSDYTPLSILLALGFTNNLSSSPLENIMNYTTYMTGVNFNAYSREDFGNLDEILWLSICRSKDGFEQVCFGEEVLSLIGVGRQEKCTKKIPSFLDSQPHSPDTHSLQPDLKNPNHLIIFEASYIHPGILSPLVFEKRPDCVDKDLLYRSTRGSNPNLEFGTNFLCLVLSQFYECFIYDEVQEIRQNLDPKIIHAQFSSLCSILGDEVDREQALGILKQLDFLIEIKNNTSDSLRVIAPDYRHDIENIQDLAEEILRIYGINKIPSRPYFSAQSPHNADSYQRYKNEYMLKGRSLALGFYECIHYVFYERERLLELGFEVLEEDLDLINPILTNLNTLRTTLLAGLLDAVKHNLSYGHKNLRLFESGSVYDCKRRESQKIAFVVSGLREPEVYPNTKGSRWDLYTFAQCLSMALGTFELSSLNLPHLALFHPYQSAEVILQGKSIGIMGRLHPKIALQMDLEDVFLCEVELDPVLSQNAWFKDFSHLPKSYRDITVYLKKHRAFETLREAIISEKIPYLAQVYPLDLYVEENKSQALSLRLEIFSHDKVLRDEDISRVVSRTLEVLEKMDATLKT